jgi:hypothetical protein
MQVACAHVLIDPSCPVMFQLVRPDLARLLAKELVHFAVEPSNHCTNVRTLFLSRSNETNHVVFLDANLFRFTLCHATGCLTLFSIVTTTVHISLFRRIAILGAKGLSQLGLCARYTPSSSLLWRAVARVALAVSPWDTAWRQDEMGGTHHRRPCSGKLLQGWPRLSPSRPCHCRRRLMMVACLLFLYLVCVVFNPGVQQLPLLMVIAGVTVDVVK